MKSEEPVRCPWLPPGRDLYTRYHDHEWGVASRDPTYLFEMLCLEGAQAGLSWWTVLQKRQRYRELYHQFDPVKVAAMDDGKLESLILDPGIIRHRGKIFSVRNNARAWLEIENPVEWIWSFIGHTTRRNHFETLEEYPSQTSESVALSKALRKAGFNYVGPTTIYAFMQAIGMVDDHSIDCFRRTDVEQPLL